MSVPRSDLVCIHGYTASWRNWGPVVGGLEQQHDVHVARLASRGRALSVTALAPALGWELGRQLSIRDPVHRRRLRR